MYTGSNARPLRFAAAVMKPISKAALCATSGRSPTKSRNARTASDSPGAPYTSRSVMPVSCTISGGMGMPGSTNV